MADIIVYIRTKLFGDLPYRASRHASRRASQKSVGTDATDLPKVQKHRHQSHNGRNVGSGVWEATHDRTCTVGSAFLGAPWTRASARRPGVTFATCVLFSASPVKDGTCSESAANSRPASATLSVCSVQCLCIRIDQQGLCLCRFHCAVSVFSEHQFNRSSLHIPVASARDMCCCQCSIWSYRRCRPPAAVGPQNPEPNETHSLIRLGRVSSLDVLTSLIGVHGSVSVYDSAG
jgi:hypothetical protein